MLDMNAHSSFDGKRLCRIAAKGNAKAMVRSAAYVRSVAKRKVKRRKHRSSPPGQPPYAHTGIFKASILYAVDSANVAAYIGPQRLASHRTNATGQPVPEILEKGGVAAFGMNANWIHKSAPRGTNTKSGIASYFKGLGKGPISWGYSPSQADAKARGEDIVKSSSRRSTKSGKMKFKVHPKRYSPIMRKKVYLSYIRIKTDRQAARVANTVVEAFGYPATNRPVKIAPRPLMGPSLADSKTMIAEFFRNTMN